MVTTLPKIDMVSVASYETLTKLREQMEAHFINGGHNIDRNTFLTKGARRTIDDNLKRVYRDQLRDAQRLGKVIEPFVEYAYINWTHEKFFNNVPQLLRVDKVLSEDPITDCLKQLPKLTYTYYEVSGHGESKLHEDTMEVFRNTLVWSEEEDETTAIWSPTQKWEGNGCEISTRELNLVIVRGKRTQKIVKMISMEMNKLEKNYPSDSFGDFVIWVDRKDCVAGK
jgi:hypothetical protein